MERYDFDSADVATHDWEGDPLERYDLDAVARIEGYALAVGFVAAATKERIMELIEDICDPLQIYDPWFDYGGPLKDNLVQMMGVPQSKDMEETYYEMVYRYWIEALEMILPYEVEGFTTFDEWAAKQFRDDEDEA